MNGESAPLHAPEPSHLALGKLVNGNFQLAEHLFVGGLADDELCDELIL